MSIVLVSVYRFCRRLRFRFLDFLVKPDQGGPDVWLKQVVDLVQHVSVEYMIHDFVPWQSGSVHQKLEGEFQPGIHLPASGLPLAFFSSFLRNDKRREDNGSDPKM